MDEETEQRLGLSGIWRLPNATEWEYACRAGSETRWYHSDRDKDLDEVAWHAGNAGATTREVGQKKENEWGLYDCHGNVAEWTDSGDDNRRVTKGGSWLMESESTTSSASGLSKVDKKSDAHWIEVGLVANLIYVFYVGHTCAFTTILDVLSLGKH